MATTKVPSPLACTGVVSNDPAARVLSVRLSENERGYARLLWRQGYQAEESGWRTGAPAVWASAPGSDRVAFAVPGDGGTLRFHFHPGEPAYQKLVSAPGLTAFVVVDRETSRFMSVKFRNNRQGAAGPGALDLRGE
jgi:hypothetical protein